MTKTVKFGGKKYKRTYPDCIEVDGVPVYFLNGGADILWEVVTNEYPDSSEFYPDSLRMVMVEVGSWTFALSMSGELLIKDNNSLIESAEDLNNAGIYTDKDLGDFLEQDGVELISSPWVMIYSADLYEDAEVAHCITDAIECVILTVKWLEEKESKHA